LRDLHGNVETRRQLLPNKQNAQVNWLGFAVAHQLAGSAAASAAVLERFEAMLEPQRQLSPEDCELVLYRANVLRLAGQHDKAVELLDSPLGVRAVSDEVGLAELRARLHWDKGSYSAAAEAFLALVLENPDNHEHHSALRAAVLRSAPASPAVAAADRMLALYAMLAKRIPGSRAIPWLIIEGLPAEHPAFRLVAAAYMRAGLCRGIPSLFGELAKTWAPGSASRLWAWGAPQTALAAGPSSSRERAPGKREIISELAAELFAALGGSGNGALPVEAVRGLGPAWAAGLSASLPTLLGSCSRSVVDGLFSARGDGGPEVSSTFPFSALLHARCLDAASQHGKALEVLEQAIKHSPTVLELYLAKGKVMKHTGDDTGAAAVIDTARSLDLADRHLNSKAVKYFLRCGQVEEAERLIALFARHDNRKPNADPLNSIHEVQVLWFELATGLALEARGDFGRALKRFAHIQAIYEQLYEDGFDYHSYCLRRMTLRAYSNMLSCADVSKAREYFSQASAGSARVYLALARDRSTLERARESASAAATLAAATAASVREKEKADMSPDAATTAASSAAAASAASVAAAAVAATAAAAAAAAVGTPEEAEKAAAAAAAAAAQSAAEEEEAAAALEAADPGIDLDPEGLKLLSVTDPLAEAWRLARAAADSLAPPLLSPARTFDLHTLTTFRRVTPLPSFTTADVDPLPDGRASAAAGTAIDLHALCAELALEQGVVGAAAMHLARALSLFPAAAADGAKVAARERLRSAAGRLAKLEARPEADASDAARLKDVLAQAL